MTHSVASQKSLPTPPLEAPNFLATNWPLALIGLASIGLVLAAAVGLALDPRLITGAPAWLKPLKFAISTVFYTLTLVWMLGYIKGHPRLVGMIGTVTAVGLAIELVLIVMQVVRGVRSHFNLSTPVDSAIFGAMGLTITVVWLMSLVAAILLTRQKLSDPAFAWSLRLGLIISSFGMIVAFLMTSGPTPSQMTVIQSGQMPQFIGAHGVGVEDGGPGLPVVGWSTEGGDLRIPHFFGLHALQALPLIGLIINRTLKTLSERRRAVLVWIAGLGYFGLTLLLTWQALRGQALIAPDVLTLGALAGLVGAVGLAGMITITTQRSVAR